MVTVVNGGDGEEKLIWCLIFFVLLKTEKEFANKLDCSEIELFPANNVDLIIGI